MSPSLADLNRYWIEHDDAFTDAVTDDIMAHAGSSYADAPREQVRENTQRIFQSWHAALEQNNPAPLIESLRQVVLQRARDTVDVGQMMLVLDVARKHIWQLMAQLYAHGDWDLDVVELVERWQHEQRKVVVSAYGEVLHEAQERLAEREGALEAQSRLIQELSAPIVPIHEGVLVLPLVGAVDSRRASQIMESALEQIVTYQADVLILDITGVPVVDTGVANYILQMARAVTLLGSRVILVGIGAEIAQTIVQLGVELRDMTTLANLQAGIAFALAQQGFAIQPTGKISQMAEIH
jgi:rsbT co-antagonist protein RsbR